MKFTYTYRSSDGQRRTAEIEAESRDAAFERVRAELGIKPIKVVAAVESGGALGERALPNGRDKRGRSRWIWGAAILAARLLRHHLDRLDAKFGPYLGKRRVAALGLDLGRVPFTVGGAVCVGELHLFSHTPLH